MAETLYPPPYGMPWENMPHRYHGVPVNETTPLNGRGGRRSRWMPVVLGLLTIFAISTILDGLYILNDPYSKELKWQEELARREKDWDRQLKERRDQEKERQEEWDREFMRRHLAEQTRIEEWEEMLEARRQQEKERQSEWDRRQGQIRENEREREDEWQREEEEREKLGLYWDSPVADLNCAGHNTREYWARLLNTVPYNYNWLKSCEDIPIDIHGRSIKTTRCYINPLVPGEVYGHWLVNFDEPLCSPYWDEFKDKGCTAERSGRRRFEAHLQNIRDGEDGEKLCASAPHDFYGQHFDHPDSCAKWGDNIFGIWEIEDPMASC